MKKYHDRDNDKSVQRVSLVVHEEKQTDFSGKGHDIKLENTEMVHNIKKTKLSHLTLEQQSDIEALIQEFKPLLSHVPKKTNQNKT